MLLSTQLVEKILHSSLLNSELELVFGGHISLLSLQLVDLHHKSLVDIYDWSLMDGLMKKPLTKVINLSLQDFILL